MKKSILSAVIILALAAQLVGCNANNQSETSSSSSAESSSSSEVSSSSSLPSNQPPAEKIDPLKWSPLYTIMSYGNIRNTAKGALGINALEGSVFINLDGHQEMNNTLYNALRNEVFVKEQLGNKEITEKIFGAVEKTFADIGDSENEKLAAFINSFWELLPSENGKDEVEFKGSKALSRAQAMTLVMRAMTPVEKNNKPNENKLFTEAVGDSAYTDYAQYVDSKAYLNTQNGLNEKAFKGEMTRAEYIWLSIKSVFNGEEINGVDTSGIELKDCVVGENETIEAALSAPSKGLPASVVEILKKANALGIIEQQTSWDRSITKTEAIQIYVDTVKAYNERLGYAIKQDTAKEDELLIAKAKASYERNKEKVMIDQDKYVSEYIRLANQGFDEVDIEAMILAEFGKRETPMFTEKPVQSSTSTTTTKPVEKPVQSSTSKPVQSSSNTTKKEPKPFTGTLKTPTNGAKMVSEIEYGVDRWNQLNPVCQVETESGVHWYNAWGGTYHKTKEDAISGRNNLHSWEVFPSKYKEGNIKDLRDFT